MEHVWEPNAREHSGPMRGAVVLLVALAALLAMMGSADAKARGFGANCGPWAEAPAPGCDPANVTIVKQVDGESPTAFPFTVSYRVGGWWWNGTARKRIRDGMWPTGPQWRSTSFDLADNGVTAANAKSLGIALRGGAWVVIRESMVDGWSLRDVTCAASTFEAPGARDGGAYPVRVMQRASDGILLRVKHGEDVRCTFTNGTEAPTLRLVKDVVNDNGGTAVAGDFTLTATGAIADNVLTGTGDVSSTSGLQADTFTLSESGPAGYAAGAWACEGRDWVPADMTPSSLRRRGHGRDDGARGRAWIDGSWGDLQPWPIVNGNQIVLGARDDVTCRIVNDDVPPSLTITKVVVNNDAGTATPADFSLTATGALEGNAISGPGPVVASGATLRADTFTLSEDGPTGYTATWVCVGGTLTGNVIPIGVGQAVSCTVTNDDVGPTPPVTPETPVAPTVGPTPAIQPVIAPPVAVRGSVRLAGPRGCVRAGTVITRVSGENMASVRFIRDGRLVKRVNVTGTGTRVVTLTTRVRASDRLPHTVTARVRFVRGATPATRTVTHTFRNCRQAILPPMITPVTG